MVTPSPCRPESGRKRRTVVLGNSKLGGREHYGGILIRWGRGICSNRAIRDFSGHEAGANLVPPEMTRMIISLPEIGRRLLLCTGWVLKGGRLLLPGNCLFSAFIW